MFTARLSPHARQRAAEMGIPTKAIKSLFRGSFLRYPANGDRWHARGDGFTVVFVYGTDGIPIVITVLWNVEFRRNNNEDPLSRVPVAQLGRISDCVASASPLRSGASRPRTRLRPGPTVRG